MQPGWNGGHPGGQQYMPPGVPTGHHHAPGVPAYIPLPAPYSKRRWVSIVVTCMVLGCIAALGKIGYGLWLGAQTKAPAVAIKGKSGRPLLAVDANIPDADLKVAATRKQMPDDIYAWLQHLQRCDMLKRDLTERANIELQTLIPELKGADGLTSAADVDKMTDPDSNFTTPPGADLVNSEIEKINTQWAQLKARFDKMPPPTECQPIADAYDAGISDTISTVGEISQILNGVNVNDPNLHANIDSATNTLRGIGKDHPEGVDNMFAQTDMLVQQICDKYDVQKWFSIDVSGGNQDAFANYGF